MVARGVLVADATLDFMQGLKAGGETPMSKTKTEPRHTPGPWRVGPYYKHEVVSNSGVICCGPIETEQSRTNARLIAAAPRLYEELFRALAVIRNPQAFDTEGVCEDIAEALQQAVSHD